MNAPIQSTPGNTRNGIRAPAQSAPGKTFTFSSGRKQVPAMTVLYGPPGIGKTTFARQARARSVFIDLEGGTNQFDVSRIDDVSTWAEVCAAVQQLTTAEHPFKLLVIDTLDKLEWLLWQHIFHTVGNGKGQPVTSIEQVGGGFGKGYQCAVEEFRRLIGLCDALRRTRGVGVMFLAHGKIANVTNSDASAADFARWELKVDKRLAGLLLEAADNVWYAHRPTVVMRSSNERERTRADLNTVRVIGVEETGGYAAKNRYGLTGTLPMDWGTVLSAMEKARETATTPPVPAAPQTTTDDTIPAEGSATTQE